MAVTSIMTTGGEIVQKMGANVSASFTEAMQDAAVLQGESIVNDLTRFNYSDAITAGLNADVVGIFSDFVSSFVAIQGIAYDMSGYTSRGEAESMVTILRDGMLRDFQIIKNTNFETFVNGA